MADKTEGLVVDRGQVKKAVQALQAFLKSKSTPDSLLLDESQHISLLFTLWKIPRKPQTIRIPLPHGIRSDTDDVCLFTKDEPNMTPDQSQRFYKKLLAERGVKNVTEVIPYQTLKTEYKPFEAKRKLLGNFDLFLSDDRVRRLLPSHLGKHFYVGKKEPISVNLQSKQLARDIQRAIQGTSIKVSKKGCCCMARVAHSGMATDEIVENIESAVNTVAAKLCVQQTVKGTAVKIIHLKSQSSVALPIYTSDLGHLTMMEEAQKLAREAKAKKISDKKAAKKDQASTENDAQGEEEIPQLVPITPPNKKAKLQIPSKKKGLDKALKPSRGKKRFLPKGQIAKKAKRKNSNKMKKVPQS